MASGVAWPSVDGVVWLPVGGVLWLPVGDVVWLPVVGVVCRTATKFISTWRGYRQVTCVAELFFIKTAHRYLCDLSYEAAQTMEEIHVTM